MAINLNTPYIHILDSEILLHMKQKITVIPYSKS